MVCSNILTKILVSTGLGLFAFGASSCGVLETQATTAQQAEKIGEQLAGLIDQNSFEQVIVDVRTSFEYQDEGHLKGSLNIPVDDPDFISQIEKLDKTKPYAVYCRSGRRSQDAVKLMKEAGFINVVDLGSFENAIAKTGLEIIRR